MRNIVNDAGEVIAKATDDHTLLSKRLGNLAQARGTIRVKSAGARRLLDHPIGRNEHGDRVGGGVILGQPGQRATRSAAKCSAIFCPRNSSASASTVAAVSSMRRIITTGVRDDNAARGPCCNSAALRPMEGRRRISESLSAISRAEPRPRPRAATNTADAVARSSAISDQSSASARCRRSGNLSRADRSARSPASSATSPAPAAIEPITVLVAATECSLPASIGTTNSASSATGDDVALTMAMVRAPAARADRVAAIRSGLRPDCEITMNSAWRSIKGVRNAVITEGALAETGRRSRVSRGISRKPRHARSFPGRTRRTGGRSQSQFAVRCRAWRSGCVQFWRQHPRFPRFRSPSRNVVTTQPLRLACAPLLLGMTGHDPW